MKIFLVLLFFWVNFTVSAQTCENIIIITTDGYRWQELFSGADSSNLFNLQYVKDTSIMKSIYWAKTPEERRKKLMPFTWNYIAEKGQIWGNRLYGNNVSVMNPYRLSYAGYNEFLSGRVDYTIYSNKEKFNVNSNLLDYINANDKYKGKVALFSSWKLFTYILGNSPNGIPKNCGHQVVMEDSLSNTEIIANQVQLSNDISLPTRSDLLTFTFATEYINKYHPKVIYIGFGETDEFAHAGRYDKYLSQANQFDKFVSEIWGLVQSDSFYRNKTTLFITTDHGRGKKSNKWSSHGVLTSGSDQGWLMQLGPNIQPLGELKKPAELKLNEFAQTIAVYLGLDFSERNAVKSSKEIMAALIK